MGRWGRWRGGKFSIGAGRQEPTTPSVVVLHPRHNRRLLSTLERETTPGFKDGEDEEGEGPPLVQGGEGQGAKEVLCAHR